MVETEVVKEKSQEKEWRPMRKVEDEASLKLFGYKEFKKEENVSEIPKETHGKYFHSLRSKISLLEACFDLISSPSLL